MKLEEIRERLNKETVNIVGADGVGYKALLVDDATKVVQSQQQKIDELTKEVEGLNKDFNWLSDKMVQDVSELEEENQQLKQELKQEEKEKKTLLRAHNKDRLKIKKLKQELEQLREEKDIFKRQAESRQRIMNNWIDKYNLPINMATLD